VSGGTALAVVMSVSAGFAGSVQAAVLGRLGDRVGTVEAVGFSTLVAGATGILVLSITFAAPKIGVAAAIGLVITGNLVVAPAIDRFGRFGVTPIALEWTRVVGILLLAGGAALVLRR
jgi:bacterial/archaeal transporter family-2 protein